MMAWPWESSAEESRMGAGEGLCLCDGRSLSRRVREARSEEGLGSPPCLHDAHLVYCEGSRERLARAADLGEG